jgi:hypothetical protein
VFRLALHVRRGEEFVVDSDRMLANSCYVSCALQFAHHLEKLNIPFVCELYTEVPSKAFVVTPQHHGIEGRIPGNMTIEPKASRIEDFDVIPNLVKFINHDQIETLGLMATADALVMSRSCFSFVPAILNEAGIVVYQPCAYSPLPEWLVSEESGVVSDAQLNARLESWKRDSF